MIQIKKLSKKYGTKQVLKNIDLLFETRKVYGVVGANGAGKTTLFRCVAGLEKFDGEILSDYEQLKNHLGFLMTEPFFFDKITGREYVQLLANARGKELRDIDSKNIFELPLNQYASTYSTGMKKKLALTAILVQHNDCFILDEPFNGVDIQSNIIISQLIHKLKDLGKTVIVSSHIFSTLADTCDEIYVLKEGQLLKKVVKQDFEKLEAEMKTIVVGDKLDKLNLR